MCSSDLLEAMATYCGHRVPLIKASQDFTNTMANPDNLADVLASVESLADAENTFINGMQHDDDLRAAATGEVDRLVDVYLKENNALTSLGETIRSGNRKAIKQEFRGLPGMFAATQVAETQLSAIFAQQLASVPSLQDY